jgi:tetratricopeptide (TPR) repeat protein
VDVKHSVSSAFQFINVPTGVWIDERGRVVRPAEPAWNQNRIYDYGEKKIVTEGEAYVEALRDWVAHGEKSPYALSDDEFARRVKPRSAAELAAEVNFKLAVWFQQLGKTEQAAKYFERAEQLNPDNWNYHRQQWSFTPQEAGKKWMDKFQKLEQPYYPKLDLKKKPDY